MSADPSNEPPAAAPRARKSARADRVAAERAMSENPDRGFADGQSAAPQPGADPSPILKGKSMSRAIDLTLTEEEVTRLCEAAGVAISAIEPLVRSGTHLVCSTSDGAAKMRRLHGALILQGPQKRSPFFVPALQR
jgi:hypothetical protein